MKRMTNEDIIKLCDGKRARLIYEASNNYTEFINDQQTKEITDAVAHFNDGLLVARQFYEKHKQKGVKK